jgi:glycosyltransferase involved in cell wall biosynthesis
MKIFIFEGFGIVFVEANAAGKPVVASASGGVTDAVSVGKSGVLVPEKDPQATARALLEFFENQERLKTMSQAALLWAQEHDWSRIADQYLKIYKELHW